MEIINLLSGLPLRNNEILAREGIDTLTVTIGDSNVPAWGNNEILAREGIDTERLLVKPSSLRCNNEILAREGIDTNNRCNEVWFNIFVTMRY